MNTEKIEKKFTMTMEIEISQEAIDEICITALEGGSNYWLGIPQSEIDKCMEWFNSLIEKKELKRNPSIHYDFLDAVIQGYEGIDIYDVEELNEAEHEAEMEDEGVDLSDLEPIGRLSMDNILKGLKTASKKHQWAFNQHVPEYNDGDGVSADALFQCMTLNDVVYG